MHFLGTRMYTFFYTNASPLSVIGLNVFYFNMPWDINSETREVRDSDSSG